MLRTLVALLVLLNGAYFVWSQGMLRDWGMGPAQVGEPERMASQIQPQAIRVLTPDEGRRLEASLASRASKKECLLAGPFEATLVQGIEERLRQLLPAEAWVLEESQQSARWIVYMGPFSDQDGLSKKLAELRTRSVKVEALRNPALAPGISMGGYSSREEANRSLQSLVERGVRTARVILELPEASLRTLRIVLADEAPRPDADALTSILPPGKPLRPC